MKKKKNKKKGQSANFGVFHKHRRAPCCPDYCFAPMRPYPSLVIREDDRILVSDNHHANTDDSNYRLPTAHMEPPQAVAPPLFRHRQPFPSK
ncbi:hypothetical protein U1Q18_039293, partial [Sarracenia purpurea var. burkii]